MLIMPRSSFTSLALVVLFSVSIFGCGGGDAPTGPDDLGSFEITYSGDESGTISGPAFFHEVTGDAPEQTSFGIFGFDGETPEDHFSLIQINTQPGQGTYDIQDAQTIEPGDRVFGLAFTLGTKDLSLFPIGGTVTLDRSDADRVTGTFEASLMGVVLGDEGSEEITVSAKGTFDAVPCEDNVEDCPPSEIPSQ